jgi:hypothetical protein
LARHEPSVQALRDGPEISKFIERLARQTHKLQLPPKDAANTPQTRSKDGAKTEQKAKIAFDA